MKNYLKYMLSLALLIPLYLTAQEETKVKDITDNPGIYIGNTVLVRGIITQFVEDPSQTLSHFLLEGKYGGIIKVKTPKSEPEQNRTYVITGTVYEENGIPFIHEDSKYCVDCSPPKPDSDMDGVPDQYDKCPNTPPDQRNNVDETGCVKEFPWLLVIIIGAGVLLIVVLIIFFVKRKPEPIPDPSYDPPTPGPDTTGVPAPEPPIQKEDDFSTIKINFAGGDQKTLKFVPGKLELITGTDKGKSFMFAGYPTEKGAEVTLGRGKAEQGKEYAHIQIDSQFRTVSRQQAVLRYKNGKLYVKNLSETNPTQLDGETLQPGVERELSFGSVIRTGELEFKYVN